MKSLRRLSQAAARYASARLRDAGQRPVADDWRARLEVCRGCPLQVMVEGEPYCGRPLWERDPLAVQADPGCGCPLRDKARDTAEHCPLSVSVGRGVSEPGCQCKWCDARRGVGST